MVVNILHLVYLLLSITQFAHSQWTTILNSTCTTRTGKRSATTQTFTRTRYHEYISTITSTPLATIPYTTLTSTYTVTGVVDKITYVKTITTSFTFTDFSETIKTKTHLETYTETYTTTTGSTVFTIPAPSGFTPVASMASTPPPPSDVDLAQATGTAKRVICHEDYLLVATITSYVRAPTIVSTTETTSATVTYDVSTTTSTRTLSLTSTSVYVKFVSTTSTYTYTEYDYFETFAGTTTGVPTYSSYTACATNNLVRTLSPYWIVDYPYATLQTPLGFDDIYDPYDCCVKCQQTTNCTGMAWSSIRDAPNLPNQCNIFILPIGATCNGSADGGWVWGTYPRPNYNSPFTISNGQCGQGVQQFY